MRNCPMEGRSHDFCSLPMLCSNHSWWRRQQNRNSAPLFALCGKFNQGWLVGEGKSIAKWLCGIKRSRPRVKTTRMRNIKCNWDWARTKSLFRGRDRVGRVFSMLAISLLFPCDKIALIKMTERKYTSYLSFAWGHSGRRGNEKNSNKINSPYKIVNLYD